MAKQARAASAGAQPAKTDESTTVIDGRDALGNDRDDVQLEDAILSEGDGSRAGDSAEASQEEAQRKKLGLETIPDARDALVAGFRARREAAKAAKTDGPMPAGELVDSIEELDDGDQGENGDAEAGEVVIIGKDGKVKATSGDEVRQPGDTGTEPATRTRGTREAPAADPNAIPDDREVTMTVDGANVRMTYGEMRRIAQQNIAAEARLREANKLLDSARRVATDSTSTRTDPERRDQADPASQETRRAPSAHTERTKVDPATVRGLVTKIQLGDDDEAAQALAEAISLGVEQGLAQRGQTNAGRVDVRSEVDRSFAERGAQGEVNEALQVVASEYADVVEDDDYARSAYARAHSDSVKALLAIGVPESDIAAVDAMTLFKEYAVLRQDPRWREKLPPMTDIFVGAAEDVAKKFNLPARPAVVEHQRRDAPRLPIRRADQQPTRIVRTGETDRSGRKARVVEQPRSSSTRTDFSGTGVAPKRTPPSDVVSGMARSRGQFTGLRQ